MKLQEINEQLFTLVDQLSKGIPALEEIEYAYNQKWAEYVLSSKQGNQASREAEATIRLNEDGITRQRLEAKYLIRTLLTRKEVLIEVSRNIRSMGKDA